VRPGGVLYVKAMRQQVVGLVVATLLAAAVVACNERKARSVRNAVVESKAVRSDAHPLAGFWKQDCKYEFGLAIGPAPDGRYFVSFCGPGGCFAEGTWRPNSAIYGDPQYRVVDEDHIEVVGTSRTDAYMRCAGRASES
jgi:hypothetical protein